MLQSSCTVPLREGFYKVKKQLEIVQDVHLFPFWFALLGILDLKMVKKQKRPLELIAYQEK